MHAGHSGHPLLNFSKSLRGGGGGIQKNVVSEFLEIVVKGPGPKRAKC